MSEKIAKTVEQKLAFIGAGRIAEAWIDRLVQTGALTSEDWIICDTDDRRLERLCLDFAHKLATKDPGEAVRFARLLVVATPPGEVLPTLARVRSEVSSDHVVISLAAGVSMTTLEATLGNIPVVRVMPNTPALVGEAMNLVVFGRALPPAARANVENLLEFRNVLPASLNQAANPNKDLRNRINGLF